jgi:hypothetical protein
VSRLKQIFVVLHSLGDNAQIKNSQIEIESMPGASETDAVVEDTLYSSGVGFGEYPTARLCRKLSPNQRGSDEVLA